MVLWAYRLSLVAAALAVCMASIGCGGGTRPTAVDGSPDGGSPPDNTPISVTDEQLIQELIADSKQVTKKYAVGKVLEVSGLVSNVFPDTAHYEPKIYLGGAKLNRPRYVDFNKGSKEDAYIHCRFRSGGERFLQIAYGQKIKVRGKSAMVFEGMGHMAPSLALEACELIDASPNTAAAVSPDELAKEFVANPAEAKSTVMAAQASSRSTWKRKRRKSWGSASTANRTHSGTHS
jgi:hypothetical protein